MEKTQYSEIDYERYATPSDMMKNLLLQRLAKAEDFFDEGGKQNEIKYALTVKSIGRFCFFFMPPEARKLYAMYDMKEIEEIKKIMEDHTKSQEEKEEACHKILMKYAEYRHNFLLHVISMSGIIQREIDVDFVMPETMEEFKKIRELIKQSGEERRYVFG